MEISPPSASNWAAYAVAWLATLLIFLLSKHLRQKKLNFPPGPKPWPIIGNLNLIGSLPHRSLHQLSLKYGPIMHLRFGSFPVVVGSSVEMAKIFLKTMDVTFVGRPKTAAGKYTTYNYSDITWSPYGPYWRQARKMCLTELFSVKRLESYEYIRVEEMNSLLTELFKSSGKPVLLKDYLSTVSLNVISRMVLGKRYLDESENSVVTPEEFKKMLDELFLLNGVFNIGDSIPWIDFLDLQGYIKRMKTVSKKFDRFLEHVLDEHLAKRKVENKSANDASKDMVDVLLDLASDPNLEVKLERHGVKGFTQDLLAGGTESSAVTVEWAISELLKNPALYNFGDSNSDTGARSAALGFVPFPNGETFFGVPSGRQCDGRLMIDFMAEKLGLPYLNAYLDSIGSNFRNGANFATGGSSILPGGYSPFHLDLQVRQFLQFKSRTSALYKKLGHQSKLPRPQEFSEALYTFDIGQNDLAHGFQFTSEAETQASIPTILDNLVEAIQTLYNTGARNFWIHNTGPIGCLPNDVIHYQLKPRNLDKNGCVEPQNMVAQEFNKQLKRRVVLLRAKLKGAAFTYVDIYSAKYSLISNAKTLGFNNPSEFCCLSYYGYQIVDCGKKALPNGTVSANPCLNPSRHISWDGIHYTEAANALVAKVVLNGSLSDPRVSISEACHISMRLR